MLRTFAAAGVEATYHACDVGDRDSLAAVLDTIRGTSGPIEGILHGAGVERSGGDGGPTKEELYEQAKDADVEGRSSMTKAELAEALDES